MDNITNCQVCRIWDNDDLDKVVITI
jgi:hypothetical protein